MRLPLPGRRLQNDVMSNMVPTKETALRVLQNDAKYFYVYGIVIVIFASYLSISEQNFTYFSLLAGALLLVTPAYLAATVQSRVAAGLLLFLTIAQLVGAISVFTTNVNGVFNLFFAIAFFFIALRMFTASILLHRSDTIAS